MKSFQSKNITPINTSHPPFFQKESNHAFFGKSDKPKPFFTSNTIQTKLTIGQPNDVYEKEADTMAGKVLQRLSDNDSIQTIPLTTNSITPFVQTKCSSCENEKELQKKEEKDEIDLLRDKLLRKPIFEGNAGPPDDEKNIQRKCVECEKKDKLQKKPDITSSQTASPHIESSLSSSKDSGSPLPHNTREQMESSFGADFSSVRIHNDSSSVQMNRDLHSQAFTHGSDIYFNSGKYNSNSNLGKHLLAHELTHVMQQANHGFNGTSLQRTPDSKHAAATKPHKAHHKGHHKPPPPVPGGNILYIGMNNYKPEIDRLKTTYKDTAVGVTSITRTEHEEKTKIGKKVYDLTDVSGIHSFAAGITKDAAKIKAIEGLIVDSHVSITTFRDDTAHVIAVYAAVEDDGKDRMTRIVFSGHSYGEDIYDEDVKGGIRFDMLVKLAGIFPKAAAQTRHILILACMTSSEDNLKKYFIPAYPNVQTIWGYTGMCPSGSGAVKTLNKWTRLTDEDPTELPTPESGQANWTIGDYQVEDYSDPADLLKGIYADEVKFNEYFDGTKVDPHSHTGFLFEYYVRVRNAAQRTSDIIGKDHDYVKLHADQSFRLRFWPTMVDHFWIEFGPKIRKGYGSTKIPNYAKLSRKDALAAIANFSSVAKGDPTDKPEAERLLIGLRDLDPLIIDGHWIH